MALAFVLIPSSYMFTGEPILSGKSKVCILESAANFRVLMLLSPILSAAY